MKNEIIASKKLNMIYSIVSTIRLLLICSIVVMLLFTFAFRKETVRGTSMYPTLKNDQVVFINVASSYLTKIKRFDVVVAKNNENHSLWVKRVVGLPGESITYKDDVLFVNGKKVKEDFLDKNYMKKIKKERSLVNFTANYTSGKLGDDEYLLVGDNRVDSMDSRNPSVGAFKKEQIVAKGLFIVSPMSEMRYVGNGQ